MNLKEYYAVIAMEECAEIQQAFAKGLRFGFDDYRPEEPDITNEQQLLTEFYQLSAMIEELQNQQLIQTFSQEKIEQIKTNKIQKVLHYAAYSKERGILEKTQDGESHV